MKKKKRALKRKQRWVTFGISFAFLLLISGLLLANHSQRVTAKELDAQEAEYEAKIQEEKEKQLEAMAYVNYMQTDEYKEREARKHFNMINPGDVLIQIKEK